MLLLLLQAPDADEEARKLSVNSHHHHHLPGGNITQKVLDYSSKLDGRKQISMANPIPYCPKIQDMPDAAPVVSQTKGML